jgi:hypothetical protein
METLKSCKARLCGSQFCKKSEKAEKPETPEEEKDKKQGRNKGRNSASSYSGAEVTEVKHEALKSGDKCPACEVGKVYNQEPSMLVRIDGAMPIIAKIYELEKLRCNMCGKIFQASSPQGIGEEKYNEKAKAVIAMLRYGAGLPMYRLENMQKLFGIPLSDATQWDIIEQLADDTQHAYRALFSAAAEAILFKTDDTGVTIMSLMKENKTGNPEKKGMRTSCIVAELSGGRKICLYVSGRSQSGENLEKVLKNRKQNEAVPIHMSDALPGNVPKLHTVISAFCLAHGRRKFFELKDTFPEECNFVIAQIGKVYGNERDTAAMTPEERLKYHQEHSLPVMTELEKWFYRKLKNKEIEPNSVLGRAVNYMQKHWNNLTTFLREPGVPLDNNECERAIKKAILHRKNSLLYKNEHGAALGDIFMTLIETCAMNGQNPIDYLVEIQKNAENIKANPENWLPWNYQSTLKELSDKR